MINLFMAVAPELAICIKLLVRIFDDVLRLQIIFLESLAKMTVRQKPADLYARKKCLQLETLRL